MVEKVVEEFGRLDCAFNNAGVGGEVHEHPRVPGGRLGPGYRREPEGRVAVHEVRDPGDAEAGGWGYREYGVDIRAVGGGGIHCVQCGEARGGGGDEDGGAGVCGGRDTGECGVPGLHLDADDYPGYRGQSRAGAEDGVADADGKDGSAGGDCGGGGVAVLGWGVVCDGAYDDAGWGIYGAVVV